MMSQNKLRVGRFKKEIKALNRYIRRLRRNKTAPFKNILRYKIYRERFASRFANYMTLTPKRGLISVSKKNLNQIIKDYQIDDIKRTFREYYGEYQKMRKEGKESKISQLNILKDAIKKSKSNKDLKDVYKRLRKMPIDKFVLSDLRIMNRYRLIMDSYYDEEDEELTTDFIKYGKEHNLIEFREDIKSHVSRFKLKNFRNYSDLDYILLRDFIEKDTTKDFSKIWKS